MQIIETNDTEDFAGRFPPCAVKGSELAKIYDWLFQNYQGYKFGIVFDTMCDEYQVPEKLSDFTVNVLFLDEIFEEAALYMGIDEAQKRLDELKEKYSHT